MASHVAFLRAVNVGGVKVPMAELREIAADLGLADVSTHLNSGNLLFSSDEDGAAVAARLEGALAERYARDIPVLVRNAAELAGVLERLPFRRRPADDKHLHVAFLSGTPAPGAVDTIVEIDTEQCVVDGREAFLHYPDGLGRSKLTTAVLERRLGVTATVRGLRTVAGLVERC
jgi:uncharacterized protein (DUF1697 family)